MPTKYFQKEKSFTQKTRMSSINYREQYIGTGTHVLKETLSQQASKAGYSIKLDAEFDDVTELEQEKLDKCIFPESLLFTVAVNLNQSKKAFLNFINGLDDPAVYDQLWNLRPHNPHTYEAPIGDVDIAFTDFPPAIPVEKEVKIITERSEPIL